MDSSSLVFFELFFKRIVRVINTYNGEVNTCKIYLPYNSDELKFESFFDMNMTYDWRSFCDITFAR